MEKELKEKNAAEKYVEQWLEAHGFEYELQKQTISKTEWKVRIRIPSQSAADASFDVFDGRQITGVTSGRYCCGWFHVFSSFITPPVPLSIRLRSTAGRPHCRSSSLPQYHHRQTDNLPEIQLPPPAHLWSASGE